MNWEAIGALGQVLGAVAVIATLLYIAREVRQNGRFDSARSFSCLAIRQNEAGFVLFALPPHGSEVRKWNFNFQLPKFPLFFNEHRH